MEGTNLNAAERTGTPDYADTMAAYATRDPETLERRLAFHRAHPDVEWTLPPSGRPGPWRATWPGLPEPVVRQTCAGLLNELDSRKGLPGVPRPKPGTAYTTGTCPNAGLAANVHNLHHFPAEAHCACGCGQMVRAEQYADPVQWVHTGRRPGQP